MRPSDQELNHPEHVAKVQLMVAVRDAVDPFVNTLRNEKPAVAMTRFDHPYNPVVRWVVGVPNEGREWNVCVDTLEGSIVVNVMSPYARIKQRKFNEVAPAARYAKAAFGLLVEFVEAEADDMKVLEQWKDPE